MRFRIEYDNISCGIQAHKTLTMDPRRDSHTIIIRIRQSPSQTHPVIIYSPTSQRNKQPPSVLHGTINNRSVSDKSTSSRHARVWDPTEVTEALQRFALGDQPLRHYTSNTRDPRLDYALGHSTLDSTQNYSHNRSRGPTPSPRSRPPRTQRPPQNIQVKKPAPTCSICMDNTNDFPRHGPTSRCTHAPAICIPCLEQYISHSILTNGLTLITCPIPECRQTLEYEDVMRGAKGDQTCINRYETLLLRRLLENDPNFIWCKNPACNWGQVHECGADKPLVICEECRAESCFTHDIPWHTGLTCKQFDANAKKNAESQRSKKKQNRKDIRESEKYIRNNFKKCPSCKRRIQKNGGCNHMTCCRPAGCGHEFCWLCLAPWDRPHKSGCGYDGGQSTLRRILRRR
ncbi:hypothetical protein B0J17DRAFT_200907 [Rhizoctonia solani]|nr:hypothetical protein B0J17DRAFT_200907 [Rhizoctonia solani]